MELNGYFSQVIHDCLFAGFKTTLMAATLFLPVFSQGTFIKPETSRIGVAEKSVSALASHTEDPHFGGSGTVWPGRIVGNMTIGPDQESETRRRPVDESIATGPNPFDSVAATDRLTSDSDEKLGEYDRKELVGRNAVSNAVSKEENPGAASWDPFANLDRKRYFRTESELIDNETDSDPTMPKEKFHWKDAIYQSLMIQGVQHAYALAIQEKTQRALKGPFFKDYWDSVKGLRGWDDGNKFFTNYIAHPMQGAMTGFIFLQNHDRMKKQKFGESKQYWRDRFKAFVWSTAWSTNWELGPISQSSIGNVGLYGHQGYVDLVMTPTAGTGWMVMEEALDRYVIRHMESRNFVLKIFMRTLLNPMRAVANALRFKEPWYRDRPFGH